jgi:peroxiredoxin
VTTAVAGKIAPDFTLRDLQGQQHSLVSALQKGPVALAFFKVSCPVCQYALPFLERIHQAYGNEKITVLGISQDDARDTRDFCKEYGLTFPALMDEDGYPVSNLYGLTNVPTMVLVQPSGRVKLGGHGFSKHDLETVARELAAAAGKPVAPVFKPGEAVPDYKPG